MRAPQFPSPAMRDLVPILHAWQARGQRCALASVVRVHGRAPLPVGASLAVAEDGATAGAVSGGCVEQEVIRAAFDVMRGGPARRLIFAPDGGSGGDGALGLGLPCGGGIDVWVQAWVGATGAGLGPAPGGLDGSQPPFWWPDHVKPPGAAGATGAGVGPEPGGLDGSQPPFWWPDHVKPPGAAGAQRAFALAVLAGKPSVLRTEMESPQETFDLVVDLMPRLVLIGAGLVAGALCALAAGLGWTVIVVDPREVVAAQAPLDSAAQLVLAWPDEALAQLAPLGPGDAVVALSHQPALDDAALRVAVMTGAGFIGALGSRRAHADRLARLRKHRGMTDAELARIVGPVGLDLGGWLPAEVAVSIAGELIAARHARAGGRLSETVGPIQAPAAERGRADAVPAMVDPSAVTSAAAPSATAAHPAVPAPAVSASARSWT